MITFKSKGDFSKVTSWFERVRQVFNAGILDKYGEAGVKALADATPKDTGLTAASWSYQITNDKEHGRASIAFTNSNIQDNGRYAVNVAIIIQYGHATKNGSWVEGIDYVNPAIRPIFEAIAEDAWKEVTR